MKSVFADAQFFVALLNPRDKSHETAKILAEFVGVRMMTTEWVVSEVLAFLSTPPLRQVGIIWTEHLVRGRDMELLPATHAQFRDGLAPYKQSAHKAWSLVDCISFVVMRRRRIREALTVDHHFAQAGFVPLLAQ